MGRLASWLSEAHLRAGDADRERVADELTRHCAEGRLTSDELSERLDVALRARTLGELAALTRDLPRLPPAAPRRRGRRAAVIGGGLALVVLTALGVGFLELVSHDPLAAMLAIVLAVVCAVALVALIGSVVVALAPIVALGLAARCIGRRLAGALDAPPRTHLGA